MKVKGNFLKKNMVLFLMIVLFAFFAIFARNFFTPNNISNLLRQTSIIGICCVGFAVVMIAGGLDLSVGSQISVIGVVSANLIVMFGFPIWLAMVCGVLLAMVFSAINGALILSTNMPPMICTLAMQQILQGVAYMMTQGAPVYGLPNELKVLGQGYVADIIPIPVIVMFACFIVGGFIMIRTYIGRYFYAVGSNPEAARLSGLKVKFVQEISYIYGGLFYGIAGMVMMSRVFSGQPRAGEGYDMKVITACVVGGVGFNGGKGTIVGLLEGVLVMGILTNGLGVMGVDTYTQMVVQGFVLIIVVGLDCFSQERAKKARMKVKTAAAIEEAAKAE